MQPLIDHLNRMHSKEWLIDRFSIDALHVINIVFYRWSSATKYPFPYSLREFEFQEEIDELVRAGYQVKNNLCEETNRTTVELVQKHQLDKINSICPDCRDTKVYQPLIGPEEPCKACT